MQMKERETKMDEFDIGNIYIDADDLDRMIFPKIEEPDSKEVEEAFNSSSYELSKTFYTSYDEKS